MKTGRAGSATGNRHDHREWYDSHNEVSAARQQSHAVADHPSRDPQRSTKTGKADPATGDRQDHREWSDSTSRTGSFVTDSRIFIYALCRIGDSTGAVRHHIRRRHGRLQSAGAQAYISVSSGWEAAKHNTQTGTVLILHKNQSR